MEDAEIVHILDIPLMKIQRHGVFLGRVMQGVKRLRLSLADGWDVRRAGEAPVSSEAPAGILNNEAFRRRVGRGLVVQKRP